MDYIIRIARAGYDSNGNFRIKVFYYQKQYSGHFAIMAPQTARSRFIDCPGRIAKECIISYDEILPTYETIKQKIEKRGETATLIIE